MEFPQGMSPSQPYSTAWKYSLRTVSMGICIPGNQINIEVEFQNYSFWFTDFIELHLYNYSFNFRF